MLRFTHESLSTYFKALLIVMAVLTKLLREAFIIGAWEKMTKS